MTREDDLRRAKVIETIRDELFAHEDTLNMIGPVKGLVLGTCDAKARSILLALREAGLVLVPRKATVMRKAAKRMNIKICSQGDLRVAQYALYLAAEQEVDPEKKAALQRIEDALGDITNWTGIDCIGSDAIRGEKEAEDAD